MKILNRLVSFFPADLPAGRQVTQIIADPICADQRDQRAIINFLYLFFYFQ